MRWLPEDVSKELVRQFATDTIDLPRYEVPADLLAVVPRDLALRERIIPVCRHEDTLWLAMADPLDAEAVQRVSELLRMKIEPVAASQSAIAAGLVQYYGGPTATQA
jgi:type IV pilus assembly protein PilB